VLVRTSELRETNTRLQQEIEQRQRVEEALSVKAAEDAVAAERTRLARELHDAVTQTLFSASILAEILPELWKNDPADAANTTEELRTLTRGALAEMRTLLLELRPAALAQARLEDLLKQLIDALLGRARLPADLVVQGSRRLPPDVQVALYRIAQEALNNIVKYAHATQVVVDLQMSPGGVNLEIRDDGVGFDPTQVSSTSLGQRIMCERAENIQADLLVTSAIGKGTTVVVTWNDPEMEDVE
jgi:signal transduction histidine kinase